MEKVIDIKLSDIDDFPDHPFKVIENEDMFNMRDSIKENGVLVPALRLFKRQRWIKIHNRKWYSLFIYLTAPGIRTDISCEQDGDIVNTNKSVNLLAEEVGDSMIQFQRFIRLTALIPELLDLVDEKQIALSPAVELSFLKDEEQYAVLDCIECNVATPSHAQAIRLKKIIESL